MVELVITGNGLNQKLRFQLTEGKVIRLGRAPRKGWAVPWDRHISREHADIEWSSNVLKVRRLETARNSIRYKDNPVETCELTFGERFQIGETVFELVCTDPGTGTELLIEELSFRQGDLDSIGFSNPEHQLHLLSRLPNLMARSESDADFATALVGLLLEALPRASAAAVLSYEQPGGEQQQREPRIIQMDSRSGLAQFQPSHTLVQESLTRGESVLHVWEKEVSEQELLKYSRFGDLDWAFCIPMRFESCRSWCFYVTGRSSRRGGRQPQGSRDLKQELRFAELLAQFIGAVHQIRMLEHRQGEMSNFFPPAVMEVLIEETEASRLRMMPREGDYTVLFCDVRGFSRRAEKSRHNLLDLLNRVSHALSVMTRNIMKHEGVIADFQGDAALAYWGWPSALDEGPMPACRAALAMYEQFRSANQIPDHPLAGFEVGIGIGHGVAVAGQIGTKEQAKVGVFGPVVNLASRLEGLTKQFQVPILVDEATAEFARQHLPPEEGRCRRLARVQPAGMETVLNVSQLMPPAGREGALDDEQVALHQRGIDCMVEGDWERAMQLFDRLPAHDLSKLLPMIYMAEHGYVAPNGWDGTIVLSGK